MNKTFRLFVSSTFSDFTTEREILQSRVFPKIRKYCAEKGGFSFQPIDLRWGVSAEAQLDQKTLELCLNEVHSCKGHPVPNFVILAGDRYGWIPLPYAVEKFEFESLLEHVTDEEAVVLGQWYEEDRNAIPTSYILKERSGKYEEYGVWAELEEHLRAVLQRAARAANLQSEAVERYFLSATEAEVMEGILDYTPEPTMYQQMLIEQGLLEPGWDRAHVFGFIRNIEGEIAGTKFDDGHPESVARFKERIRASVENVLEVTTAITGDIELEGGYLAEFEDRMLSFLKERVDLIASEAQATSPLEAELQAQRDFLESKTRNFQGRQASREIISAYLAGTPHPTIEHPTAPLVVYGPSGRGKSALMAKVITEAQMVANRRVVYRFTSATPESSSSKGILLSVFEELEVALEEPPEAGEERQAKQESFEDFSERVRLAFLDLGSRGDSIVVILDAIDQASNPDRLLWLPDRLPENVRIVISLLNDEKYPDDSKYYQAITERNLNFHEIPPIEEPIELLRATLAAYDRRLQPHQERYFLAQYASSSSPLFVTLAAEELRHWRSTDAVEGSENPPGTYRIQDLADSQQGLVREFLSNLHDFYHHDEEFVARVLGYIHASRDGLSEGELLHLLSADREFVQRMAPDTWHKNITGELPTVIWSRLAMQLRPFFKQNSQDGQELLSFFHREFASVIGAREDQRQLHRLAIEACRKLVAAHLDEGFENTRWGKLYLTLATEHELRYPDQSELEGDAGLVSGLNDDAYIESFLRCADNEGDAFSLVEKTREAIAYREIIRATSTPLYRSNPNRWAEQYTLSLNSLAHSYKSVNRTTDAIVLEEESLSIRKALYEKNSNRWVAHYTTSLNNLAHSYDLMGRTKEAAVLEERSLLIRKELYDRNPEKWAESYTTSLNNLCMSFFSSGRTKEAIDLGEESLSIRRSLYRKNPSRHAADYAIALNNLALSYESDGRIEDTIALEEESLSIIGGLYGSNQERWADTYTKILNNLAHSYFSMERSEEAIAKHEESLSIRKKLYEQNPYRWAEAYSESLGSLATTYHLTGRTKDATPLQKESLSIVKALYDGSPGRWANDYADALNNLGVIYREQRDYEAAEPLVREAATVYTELYGERHKTTATLYSSLGWLLHLRGDDATAIEFLEKALDLRSELLGADATPTIKVRERLEEVRKATGPADQ